ncbi:Damage-control phosphatase ARMT1-like metal-binding domain-containing protein [Candidatus Electronema halotolerans]
MRTSLDCLVCYLRQARSLGLRTSTDLAVQRRLLDETGRFLATVDTDLPPPENSGRLYPLFAKVLGTADPFAQVKEESNALALSLREEIRQRIEQADDSLRAAVRAAIGGNIIDYGSLHNFDVAQTMQDCFARDFAVDDYPALRQAVSTKGRKVLYLCDNSGEIVFDGLLIEQLQQLGCHVTTAVRESPIINDATLADARACGLDQLCPVISSGMSCPGTVLSQCSEEFLTHFQAADLIISKGMGNFESLSDQAAPLFFLLTVKCAEVVRYIQEKRQLAPGILQGKGEMVLLRQQL